MKKNDKNAASSKEYSKDREFGVVLERIHTEIKVIAEGQSMLRDKLDATMGMVARNTEDITMINLRASLTKDELNRMNGKLVMMENDIAVIKSDVAVLKTDVKVLKVDIAEFRTNVNGHASRLAHLEAAR